MCQLLAMNSFDPMTINFSFTGFCARGGLTGEHSHGWGIAFFEEEGCRVFIDSQASIHSPVAEFIKQYPIKSRNVIAHVRKATKGKIALKNCHPFTRELWGRYWAFAHNGTLTDFTPKLSGRFTPVGDTDSEAAFCYLLEKLHAYFPLASDRNPPPIKELYAALQTFTAEITQHGTFNFILSSGEVLFAHCSNNLHYVTRRFPFSTARLVDCDMSIDFSQHNRKTDAIAVIATQPLTSNELWTAFKPGELLMFQQGEPTHIL